MYRLRSIFLFLSIFILFSSFAYADTYKERINNILLTINSPQSFVSNSKKIFVDKKEQFSVKISFGELKVEANRIEFDLKSEIIELKNGFKGELEEYRIEGEYFRINPKTGNYAGTNLKFGYLVAYLYGEEFQFYGDKIWVKNTSASPLHYPIFNLSTGDLLVYPAYMLAKGNTLRFFAIPFYYIPLYFEEKRRAYYDLPFPAPDVKKDIFHGTHGSLHSHYFINPVLYGDISLKSSELDGIGGAIQQIVRLSDHQQLELKYLHWDKVPAQSNFTYMVHFFGNPRKPEDKLSFKERQKQEEEIAVISPFLILVYDYTQNEEIARSIVDRTSDLHLMSSLGGILYDHTFTLKPSLHYGKIKEKKIYPENQTPQNVSREYHRIRGNLDFTYYLETPQLKPFIQKALLGLNYEHSEYDPGNSNRGRVSGSLTVRRPIIKAFGLFYEAILTKVLLDYGTSPFFFEEYGRLKDSGILDIYLDADPIIAGNQITYDITNLQPYNEIYYLGVKAGNNYATINYNRRMESWQFAFMRKEAAF